MTQASCKIVINISADAIWQAIGEFGAAGRYLAGLLEKDEPVLQMAPPGEPP